MGKKMSKWLKNTIFAFLLFGAGFFFGTICKQIGNTYTMLLTPSWELLFHLLWFLLGAGIVAVCSGLVAVLVRPVWVGFIGFVCSGVAILLGWQMTTVSVILVLVYLLASCIYTLGVARELTIRIRFSVHAVNSGLRILLTALVFVACGSLYSGYETFIKQQGFSVPDVYIEVFTEQIEKQIEERVSEEERAQVLAEFRDGFQRIIDEYIENKVKPYERLIPLGVAAGLFMTLVTITNLLAWVPTVVLSFIFHLLTVVGVTKVVKETQEVERLVIT
jgi:hypothetical protein